MLSRRAPLRKLLEVVVVYACQPNVVLVNPLRRNHSGPNDSVDYRPEQYENTDKHKGHFLGCRGEKKAAERQQHEHARNEHVSLSCRSVSFAKSYVNGCRLTQHQRKNEIKQDTGKDHEIKHGMMPAEIALEHMLSGLVALNTSLRQWCSLGHYED